MLTDGTSRYLASLAVDKVAAAVLKLGGGVHMTKMDINKLTSPA